MARKADPKWHGRRIQNGTEVGSKMAWKSDPKWHGSRIQNDIGGRAVDPHSFYADPAVFVNAKPNQI